MDPYLCVDHNTFSCMTGYNYTYPFNSIWDRQALYNFAFRLGYKIIDVSPEGIIYKNHLSSLIKDEKEL